MPQNADVIYKSAEDIVDDVLAAFQARMPGVAISPDSIVRLWTEVFANSTSGVYLSQQLLHDDMFIQTMSALALQRAGEMFGRPRLLGTLAEGSVRLGGTGGTFIPAGMQVAAPRPALDDSLLFVTTEDGTIPDPGIADAPTLADGGAGSLDGTYEYAVTFVTDGGETELGDESDALIVSTSEIDISDIALGGDGTTARRLYRRDDGGDWLLITEIADNVTTVYTDDDTTPGPGSPPEESTAERVTVTAEAIEPGEDYNVGVGAINELADVVAGVDSVINVAVFADGTEPEDIEVFRTELLKWVRAPMSGAPQDLIAWATSVPGVESAAVFPNVNIDGDPTPGTVVVRISATGGAIPDGDLITLVQETLDAHTLATITIIVASFDATTIFPEVSITAIDGFVLGDVILGVQEAVRDYVNRTPVAGTVYIAGILRAVLDTAGIVNVQVRATNAPDPPEDITADATEKFIADYIDVDLIS